MYLNGSGVVGLLRGGDLARALAASEGLDQAPESVLVKLAREADLPPDIVLKAYHVEMEALRKARDKPAYIRARVAQMKADYAKGRAEIARLKGVVARAPERDRPALVADLAQAEKRLAVAESILRSLESRAEGLSGWPLLLFGLALATPVIWAMFANIESIKQTVEQTGNALVVGAYITFVSVGLIGVFYFARIVRDIWTPPEKA